MMIICLVEFDYLHLALASFAACNPFLGHNKIIIN